jgi:hypothetical protein
VLFVIKHRVMKSVGSGYTALRMSISLGIRRKRGLSFTPRPPYHRRQNPWYVLDKELSVPQSLSGRFAG